MADRAQLLNDPEEAFRLAFEGRQSAMWTAMPGIVTEVDLSKNTCSVQLAIQGTVENENGEKTQVNYPMLADVPIVWPRAGGFVLTFPLAVNDEVLVVFSSRCIDAWWQNGSVQRAMEARMHDLSDGFAIPGPSSQPKVISNVSSTETQLRNEAGDTYLSITADGKIGMVNATTDMKEILTDLQTVINTFMNVLAGFGGGGAATTQAMLQAPAAAAVSSLAPILVKIGALLK